MEIQLYAGKEVLARLDDAGFQKAWKDLYSRCPWATGGQDIDFVSAWYNNYSQTHLPVMLSADDGTGGLCGVFALTKSPASNELIGAGGPQSEYQCWLAQPECSDAFIHGALGKLQSAYPRSPLHLWYLPQGLPLNGIRAYRAGGQRCVLKPIERPHVRIDVAQIANSLGRKGNKNLMNRMQRLGPVKFERVLDPEELARILDEYILQYDFRQAALYDCPPFRLDPMKRAFYQERLRRGLMHVTVMRVGDAIASINLGQKDINSVQLGLSHAPSFAPYSPGKFHIYLLCMELAKEGVEFFDLTPGGGYKENFANATDEVHDLYIYHYRQVLNRSHLARHAHALASMVLRELNISSTEARLKYGKARHLAARGLTGAMQLLRKATHSIYLGGQQLMTVDALPPSIAQNKLDDLLAYDGKSSARLYQEFQLLATKRLENGQQVYTSTKDGCLDFCGWVIPSHDGNVDSETSVSFELPEGAVIVHDVYRNPAAEKRESEFHRFLEQVFCDLARRFDAKQFYVIISDDDGLTRKFVESIGFRSLVPGEGGGQPVLQ